MRWLALLFAFHSSVAPAPSHMAAWHRGCPVPISDLRLVTLTYWGFDDRPHAGQLVLNRDVVRRVIRAMRSLYAVRFAIRRMVLVDRYGADDDRSMAADNTSAFNCLRVEQSTSWSQHTYGRAVASRAGASSMASIAIRTQRREDQWL